MNSNSRRAFVRGTIYTMDEQRPWAEAILVDGQTIVSVGTNDEIRAAAGDTAEIVELGGGMVMPGIHDAHIHLLLAGLRFKYECKLKNDARMPDIVDTLCACERCRPNRLGDWVLGYGYDPATFAPGEFDREAIDARFPDTPVFLSDFSSHHGFANGAALRLAGIDADTPDPFGGRYVRREGSTEPTGELIERATWALRHAMPDHRPDIYFDAVQWSVGMANRYGITSVQEASGVRSELDVLKQLDAKDELTLHVTAHLVWKEEAFSGGASQEELNSLLADHARYASAHVRTHAVKCWLDGAPIAPYFTQSSMDPATALPNYDNILISEEELTEMLTRLDREGRTLKIHCSADGAVRVALDALERVRKANGPDGPVHEIAHALFIDESDLPRFEELNVIAEMSPAMWHDRSPKMRVLDSGCKFGSLKRSGARVTIGSDWLLGATPNLFPPLQGILDRGEESVPLPVALRMMTIDGARAVGMEERIGSLEPGKSADFIVLDRNLFEIPITDVGETVVMTTIFEGRTVYSAA